MGNNPSKKEGQSAKKEIQSKHEELDDFLQEDGALQLDGRKLTELPDSIFSSAQINHAGISTLNLNFNRLTAIPTQLATTFINLTDLSLAANRIESLPLEIMMLKRLEYLHLGVNKISELPEEIGHLVQLKELNVASNRLSFLPDTLERLTALQLLSLTSNKLTAFPSRLPPSLKTLQLRANSITAVPPSIMLMLAHSLVELDLSENSITSTLPIECSQLSRLQRLFLACNDLSSLLPPSSCLSPEEDAESLWPELQQLDIAYNNFKALPLQLRSLAKLRSLTFYGNPFCIEYDHNNWAIEDKELLEGLQKQGCNFIDCKQDNIPDKILDSVFLGSIESAKNKHLLKQLGVTHILCVCPFKPFYPSDFEYCKLVIDDAKSDKFMQQLPACLDFIQSAIDNKGTVLIHCRRGVSRSGAITTAYVMLRERKNFEDALAHVVSCRSCVHPKECFREDLTAWQPHKEPVVSN